MTAPVNTKASPGLRTKLRHKRRIILGLWTLWFAYLSLTHEVQPASGNPTVSRRYIKDREDRHTFSTSLKWRAPEGYSAHQSQLLQATGAGVTSEEDLEDNLVAGYNCTNPAILEFPPDLFTQDERQGGAIVIHFLASMYIFYAIALVCDDYFVPSIESICEELHLPSDVAGATFMAIATSSPELFTNVIGTFITEGDIGVGTIVGSAVFNLLAVCACCGFAASAVR
ncbi:unnamed protein product [Allacma fusca]|uniref:Sodium/calcium exchanger membrane region domain-containing protein n=1 Tax=Allacma fusca TaxID=39272 RepID=A0A8J2KCI2_9HEXA|nr:unnamed protein product [Allacma fusca]